MWSHFVNLLSRSWNNVLASLGTSTLAVVLFLLAAPFVTFVATFIVISRLHPERVFVKQLEESALPAIIGFLVPLLMLILVFGWKIVRTVYDDHQALTRDNAELKQEKDEAAIAGSLPFDRLDTFWLDRVKSTPTLQVGIVLSNLRDKLLEFHVDKLDVRVEGQSPNNVQTTNQGGYCYPLKSITFMGPAIEVKNTSKRPLNGELEYMVSYHMTGSRTLHHSGKSMKFDYYPSSSQYPIAQVRWVYVSEHED